jgi:hypothetical protein
MVRRIRYPDIFKAMPLKQMAQFLHGEQILCLAMINRALLDKKSKDMKLKNSAKNWLEEKNDSALSLNFCLKALKLNHSQFKKILVTHQCFFA